MEPPRRTRLTEADRALWASYASRIRPLAGRGRPPTKTGPEPSAVPPARQAPLATVRVHRSPLAPLAIGTHPGGVDGASWRRFRTGKLPAARTLDLHGRRVVPGFYDSHVHLLGNPELEAARLSPRHHCAWIPEPWRSFVPPVTQSGMIHRVRA
jgi:hypothetical protein